MSDHDLRATLHNVTGERDLLRECVQRLEAQEQPREVCLFCKNQLESHSICGRCWEGRLRAEMPQEQPRRFTAEERRAIRHCAVSAMEKTAPCCTEAGRFVRDMLGPYDPALESAEAEASEGGKYE